MTEVHTYDTKKVLGKALDSTSVLVGESGGLSAVYEVNPSAVLIGCLVLETEHGPLYLDPDEEYEVIQ